MSTAIMRLYLLSKSIDSFGKAVGINQFIILHPEHCHNPFTSRNILVECDCLLLFIAQRQKVIDILVIPQ